MLENEIEDGSESIALSSIELDLKKGYLRR